MISVISVPYSLKQQMNQNPQRHWLSMRDAYVLRHPPERLARKTVSRSEKKSVYNVLNMDIFLTKTHRFATGGLYSPPGAMWGTFYYVCACFIWLLLDCWTKTPPTPILTLGRARIIFYITPIDSSERRKSYTPRILWGWVKHGLIFIYGWTNPFKSAWNGSSDCLFFSTVTSIRVKWHLIWEGGTWFRPSGIDWIIGSWGIANKMEADLNASFQ